MISTPHYLIDEARLLDNLATVREVRERSGAKVLLALKCFATWSVFDLMRDHMDGTTSSSLFEVKLGRQRFGGETHAYSVAFADHEIDEVVAHADKIIFNSISQFERFSHQTIAVPRGLRLNPRISASGFDLADPARPYSRLGEWQVDKVAAIVSRLDGFMIHNNCENHDFHRFDRLLAEVEAKFGELIGQVDWISLGGGIHFTAEGYPVEAFCRRLSDFSDRYGVQVYLEPGEAAVTRSASLELSVLDVLFNEKHIAIVDGSTEAHMLDLLIYRQSARVEPGSGPHRYLICGKSCLAGDVFGEFGFDRPLKVGDRISIEDAAAYTMVKKNWFNGLQMPAVVIRRRDGTDRIVREFTFDDFLTSLS
jgi:carboxynorspermidine decarboxylase